jgi:hypothetical protein
MQRIAENLWIKTYPLNFLGGHHDRVVTLIRLRSGRLIIHSTGPFTLADVSAIESLGTPGWLVDSMLQHDTFAEKARAMFPHVPYLAPPGFAPGAHLGTLPLLPAPAEWAGEVRVLEMEGMPSAREHVVLHVSSRTLIVADLVFNFAESHGWTSFFRRILMGVREHPDAARLYPLLVRDRAVYNRSLAELMLWDFERIIVGHNQVVPSNGKALLRDALARKGMA